MDIEDGSRWNFRYLTFELASIVRRFSSQSCGDSSLQAGICISYCDSGPVGATFPHNYLFSDRFGVVRQLCDSHVCMLPFAYPGRGSMVACIVWYYSEICFRYIRCSLRLRIFIGCPSST